QSTDDVFDLLRLNADKEDLFKNPLLNTYYESDKEKPLASRYDDEHGLASVLALAKADIRSRTIVTNVEEVQLSKWLKSGETEDSLYKLLRLSTDSSGSILKSPALSTWFTYVRDFEQADPYKLQSLKNLRKTTATELQRLQFLANTADDVFKRLRLDIDMTDKLLKNPAMGTWITYVKDFEKKDSYNLLAFKLTKSQGEDSLANVLVAAKSERSTKEIVTKLETEQFKFWLCDEKTTDDVFKLLRLDFVNKADFLKSPALDTWMSYVNKRDGLEPNNLGLFILIRQNLRDMPNYIWRWRDWRAEGENRKSAEDAFKLLRLNADKEGEFLKNLAVTTWVSYMYANKLSEENPSETLVHKFSTSYGDVELAKMLSVAMANGLAKDTATKMENAFHKTTDEIFKLLGLNVDQGDQFLKNPLLSTWISYFTYRKSWEDPLEVLLFELTKRYDEREIASMTLAAKAHGRNSKIVAGLEQQIASGIDLLKNPELRTWYSYIEMLKQKPEELLFAKLKTRLGGEACWPLQRETRFISGDWTASCEAIGFAIEKTADDVLAFWDSTNLDLYKTILEVMNKHYEDTTLEKMIDQVLTSSSAQRLVKAIASKLKGEMLRRR
ncbi:hypothetical protein GN958_ATG23486, partial [Phytophthora infestans]